MLRLPQRGRPPAVEPGDLVDTAIAEGRIDRELVKSAKARAVALIEQTSKLTGPLKELEPKIAQIVAASAPKGELTVEQRAAEKNFQAEMQRILATTSFSHEGLSWKSFPNHAGHKDTPGCFRCHDGKHLNEQGQAIRLQCTLCHDLPQVMREKGKGSVPSTKMAGMTQPDSHNEPNFMHDHRMKFDQTCTMCHGKDLEFGRDGGNFCANPACHGRKWPAVNLSAKNWKRCNTDVDAAHRPAVNGAPGLNELMALSIREGEPMKKSLMTLGLAAAALVLTTPAFASEELAKSNGCTTCHDATKEKNGALDQGHRRQVQGPGRARPTLWWPTSRPARVTPRARRATPT